MRACVHVCVCVPEVGGPSVVPHLVYDNDLSLNPVSTSLVGLLTSEPVGPACLRPPSSAGIPGSHSHARLLLQML